MSVILEVDSLRKNYGDVQAVRNIDLQVPEGICFGLLGPNGAGKTTTIEIMEGILRPTSGRVLFRGKPLGRHYRDRIGIQFQRTSLQEFITVEETLKLFASLYSETRPLDEIVEVCALQELLKRDNRKLSGGQRQRMLLGLALVNNPDLIFLDEPTTGLDPQARRNFWTLIENIKSEGRTVVLTTHYMDEAEKLCEEITIMDHGLVIAHDSPTRLLKEHFEGVIIRVPYSGGDDNLPAGAQQYDDHIDIQTNHIERSVRELIHKHIPIDGLSIHTPNLDDLFMKMTGTALRG